MIDLDPSRDDGITERGRHQAMDPHQDPND